jgi:4-hydroxy-4-methyl-2-oxoglutarate aldolase
VFKLPLIEELCATELSAMQINSDTSVKPALSSSDFEAIRRLDTCRVSNAIERLKARPRNEGFAYGTIHCQFPHFSPMLGYAATARCRAASTPVSADWYHDRIDFLKFVMSIPEPRVIVFQDMDHPPGFGSLVGEIHATVAQALGCVGCVTNGAVRDLPAVERMGFQLFAGGVSVSHAFAHIADFGQKVAIAGLEIAPGDLIHGDMHGIQTIPLSIAHEIPLVVEKLAQQEQALIAFCRSPEFSLSGLVQRIPHGYPFPDDSRKI